ncbi:LysR family transcriptional regulator [Altererythrobacter xixiisoli]|uniref:LysR family transcriptional regulator n=1 Tax=Croceibacterium xixiisoli TaxID=1476466 RepID=A0A6I4TY65_9SPHN|nr:LysR family transcriptional regulator [Croceibacterium xixiisoli]MXO99588.1 LysR family transcriptional regulator [Croceibacterium xixiisoli]
MAKEKLRDLDLNLLIVFDALLRCENVSRAADELDMSQSAVSHALKRLRDQFDDPLFIRARDRMVPTPKTLAISDYILEIMRLTRSTLLPSSSFDPDNADWTLTVALGDVGDMVILPALARHLRAHQAQGRLVSVPATSDEAVDLLATGKLDIYVGIMDASSSDILCQKLYDDHLVFICAQDCPLQEEISFEQYEEMDHILLQSRSSPKSGQFISQALQRNHSPRPPKIETPYISSVPMIVEGDKDIVAVVPHSLAQYFCRTAKVRILTPKFYLPPIAINQYWHKRFDKDPFIVWARQTLRKILSSSEISLH